MKIRQRLTLSFVSTIVTVLIIFGVTIYYFSSQYRQNEFFNRLIQRVEITEKMFLERENLSPETYELIREQFLNKLPEETEEVIELKTLEQVAHAKGYSPEFIETLMLKEVAYFDADTAQGVGRIFHLPKGTYAVILTAKDRVGIQMLSHLFTIIILSLVGCIFAVNVVSYYISGKLLNPISKKIQKANAISAKNLHERLIVHDADDEIGELAIAFNNLLDRVASAFNAQRLFIDNASHEIRNPLTAIMGEAEVTLEKERTKDEYVTSIQSIAIEADRLNSLVNNLLNLANISYREFAYKSEPIDLRKLLNEAKRKFDFLSPDNQIKIHSEISDLYILGNSTLLQTAFINIFDNAIKFSFNKQVDVRIYSKSSTEVVVSVRDQGLGIPPEDIPKVTQPFHRAHNVRQIGGTGIGIPLTLKIIELHRGTLGIKSELNKGTEVEVTLPILA